MVAGYADAVSGDPAALQVWASDDRTLVVVIEGHCSYFLQVVCTAVSTMPVRASVTLILLPTPSRCSGPTGRCPPPRC